MAKHMTMLAASNNVFQRVAVCFPHGSGVKSSSANAGAAGSSPGAGRSLGGGNGNLLQYSCLGNPMDRGAWRATVQEVAEELDTT